MAVLRWRGWAQSERERSARRGHHSLLQLILRLGVNAGRIRIDELIVISVEDAEDAVARRARLWRHDGEPLADQPVHQRRLAHVWHADDGDEAGAMRCGLGAVLHGRANRLQPRRDMAAPRGRAGGDAG